MVNYDKQFNLRKRHPIAKLHMVTNALQSKISRARLNNYQNISYGESAGEKLDIFPAASDNAPVFIFIHGGYFRALDKKQYSYLATPLTKVGYTVVVINYDLAPTVSVSEICTQNLKAFLWVHQNIDRWHGNPNDITLCGHSVGAFLVAKILEHSWNSETRLAIKKALLLSGLYDLAPMQQSYLNCDLKLTDNDVFRLSPINVKDTNFPNTIIAVGDNESDEFISQSTQYFYKLNAQGTDCELMLLKGKNHYTVSRMLASTNNILMKKVL